MTGQTRGLEDSWWAGAGHGRLCGRRAARASPVDRVRPSVITAAGAFLQLAATVAGAAWMWPHVWDATRLWIWDDYTYHMVYPALWLRKGAIAAVDPAHAFTMQAWYPLGASLYRLSTMTAEDVQALVAFLEEFARPCQGSMRLRSAG